MKNISIDPTQLSLILALIHVLTSSEDLETRNVLTWNSRLIKSNVFSFNITQSKLLDAVAILDNILDSGDLPNDVFSFVSRLVNLSDQVPTLVVITAELLQYLFGICAAMEGFCAETSSTLHDTLEEEVELPASCLPGNVLGLITGGQ